MEKLLETIMNKMIDNTTCELSGSEWSEIEQVLAPYIKELDELRKMVDWMELNSNSSLCDFYNKD